MRLERTRSQDQANAVYANQELLAQFGPRPVRRAHRAGSRGKLRPRVDNVLQGLIPGQRLEIAPIAWTGHSLRVAVARARHAPRGHTPVHERIRVWNVTLGSTRPKTESRTAPPANEGHTLRRGRPRARNVYPAHLHWKGKRYARNAQQASFLLRRPLSVGRVHQESLRPRGHKGVQDAQQGRTLVETDLLLAKTAQRGPSHWLKPPHVQSVIPESTG